MIVELNKTNDAFSILYVPAKTAEARKGITMSISDEIKEFIPEFEHRNYTIASTVKETFNLFDEKQTGFWILYHKRDEIKLNQIEDILDSVWGPRGR